MATVASISMVKNGVDIIEPVFRHLATQVDFMIVADNNSNDGSRELLNELSREIPLSVVDDPDPAYFQSKKMSALAKTAGNMGAEWVVPVDQDEIFYSPFGTIKEVLSKVEPQWLIATAAMYDQVTSSEDNPEELNLVKRIGWRRIEKGLLPKVACRVREDLVIEQGNHGAIYGGGATRQEGLLVVRHYPYRSIPQFIDKVRAGVNAYKGTNLPESSGAHWKGYGRLLETYGESVLEEVYNTWFHLENPRGAEGVIYDPAPIYSEAS